MQRCTAHAEALKPASRLPRVERGERRSTSVMLSSLRLAAARRPTDGSGTAEIQDFAFYAPRHCVSASAVSAQHGSTESYASGLLVERGCSCGEDEDAASMALTAMHRLVRRCRVLTTEVGHGYGVPQELRM